MVTVESAQELTGTRSAVEILYCGVDEHHLRYDDGLTPSTTFEIVDLLTSEFGQGYGVYSRGRMQRKVGL